MEKVIEEISSDHECSVYSMLDILDENNGKGTVILITDKPISKEYEHERYI